MLKISVQIVNNQHSVVMIFDNLLKKGIKVIKKLNVPHSFPTLA